MKKNAINILGIVLMAVSLAFVVHRVVILDIDFSKLLTPTNAAMLVVMPFLSVTVIFSSSYCWKMVLALFTNRKIPAGNSFAAYAKSNVMKYLPGNVGHYMGRQIFGAQMGISQFHLAIASILELGYSALSMVLCAVVFSARTVLQELHARLGEHAVVWLCAIAAAGIVALVVIAVLFRKNKYVSFIIQLLKTSRFWLVIIAATLIFSFASLVCVAEYVVLFGQYTQFSFHDIGIIMSANFVAIFVGYITPGAPGGIGVREATLLAMLSPHFPADFVLFASIMQRLISIAGDIITAPISLLLAEKNVAQDNRATPST